MSKPTETDLFTTPGGVLVRCGSEPEAYENARTILVEKLDRRRGALLSSDFEYPGRYTRWDMGFVDPPLETLRGRTVGAGDGAVGARAHPRGRAGRAAAGMGIRRALRNPRRRLRRRDPTARRAFPRRGRREPPALGLLAGARDPGLPARAGARALPRPLRRVRLQPRLPVRAAGAQEQPRGTGSATSCSTSPTGCSSSTISGGEATWRSYEFEIDGRFDGGGWTATCRTSRFRFAPAGRERERPCAGRLRRKPCARRKSASARAICSRPCPASTPGGRSPSRRRPSSAG